MQGELSNTIINDVLQLIVPLIISGIVGYIAKTLVPSAKAFIEAHADERLRALIDRVVDTAVRGVESERLRNALEGSAFNALKAALDTAEDMLLRYGITLDKAEMTAAILAALHKVRQEQFELETVSKAAAGGSPAELPFDDEHTTRGVVAAPTYQQVQQAHAKNLMWLPD